MNAVFALLIAYQLKHWICDFPLQNEYMLGKFKEKGWVLPLAAHAWIHFLGTYLIVSVYSGDAVLAGWAAIFDFAVHFAMDRIKAAPHLMGRWKPLTASDYSMVQEAVRQDDDTLWPYMTKADGKAKLRGNKLFWWALGFDQMVHHLTHYFIIYAVVQ